MKKVDRVKKKLLGYLLTVCCYYSSSHALKQVTLCCKEKIKEFFDYVNNRKVISRKISPLKNTEGNLHFFDEKNVLLLNYYFSYIYCWKLSKLPQLGISKNGILLKTWSCTSDEILRRIDGLEIQIFQLGWSFT